MILNTVRHYLSYLWDIQIDYRYSDINGDLVVFLVKGRYQLCTANAIYSFEDRYDNFGNLFRDKIDLEKLSGNKVLILGLGLGSVPVILDGLKPGIWCFTAVEIDPVVCELASIYGYPKITSPIETLIIDATIFMATNDAKFDLICMDLFIDENMPESCLNIQFLKEIKRCLNPNGLVITNTLAFSEAHKKKSKHYFEQTFQNVFHKAELIETHRNFMLLSDKKQFK